MKINISLSILLFIFPISLFPQSNPIVQVDPVVNLSDEAWLEAVCDAATDNVLFTLNFLGQFDVISDTVEASQSSLLVNVLAVDNETIDTSSLKTRAETEGYDNILFGSCTIEDGSYVITMNAYDLALDKIIYSGSTVVESIFDTFEAVDQITYQTVEGFSGIHVTYGSLVLVPPGTGEPFSFTIDGIALPMGTFSVDRMPAGVHKLAVSQERPLGLHEAIHEIVVEEEIENRIGLPIPNITGEEITVFNQGDRYLTLASMGKEPGMPLAMNNLYSLVDTPFFQQYRAGLVDKYETWVSMLDAEIAFSNKSDSMKVSQYIRSLWYSENQKGVSNNIVSLSSQFERLLLSKEQLEANNIFIPTIKTIKLDGREDDWGNVSTVFIDRTGDFYKAYDENAGQDISWVGVAADENRFYFAMETASKIYRNDCQYRMEIKSTNMVELRYNGSSTFAEVKIVQNNDWNNAKYLNSEDSPVRGNKGEIVELSYPLDQIEKWLEYFNGSAQLVFSIRTAFDPWTILDTITVQVVFPSIYNAFRAEDI